MYRNQFAAITLGILACTAATPQAIIERGAAAASGSTAGAVVGKRIGDMLTNVDKVAKQAAGTGQTQTRTQPAKSNAGAPSSEPAHAARSRAKPAAAAPKTTAAAIAPEAAAPAVEATPAPAAPPEPPEPPKPSRTTVEELSSIKTGMARTDLEKLGPPNFRISLPENGHSVEILRYRTEKDESVTIRVVDGVVASVELPSR
jgi:hypothetical protein